MAGLLIRLAIIIVLAGPMVLVIVSLSGFALPPSVVAAVLLALAFASGAIDKPSEAFGFALIVDFALAILLLSIEIPGIRAQVASLTFFLPLTVGLALGLLGTIAVDKPLPTEPELRTSSGRRAALLSPLRNVLNNKFVVLIINAIVTTIIGVALRSGLIDNLTARTGPIIEASISWVISIALSAVALVFGALVGSILTRNELKTSFRAFRDATTIWFTARRHLLVSYTLGYLSVIVVFFGVYVAGFWSDPRDAFRRMDESSHLVTIALEPGRDVPFAELFYFSMNTIAPLGYSELRPFSPAMRLAAFSELTFGIGWTVV
ncbi:MAG TPA: ion channel, partial [Ktedonobacterales bacterium]|nr:ion channel [Ktedonobacterales bacterium]